MKLHDLKLLPSLSVCLKLSRALWHHNLDCQIGVAIRISGSSFLIRNKSEYTNIIHLNLNLKSKKHFFSNNFRMHNTMIRDFKSEIPRSWWIFDIPITILYRNSSVRDCNCWISPCCCWNSSNSLSPFQTVSLATAAQFKWQTREVGWVQLNVDMGSCVCSKKTKWGGVIIRHAIYFYHLRCITFYSFTIDLHIVYKLPQMVNGIQ